ncbi:MAG: retroviral-like aspartic protease family protein [Gemmatimonadetes bacterium]|nr:retroviral-like aspartic protease family protein [Gemmatimonadota bacterium]
MKIRRNLAVLLFVGLATAACGQTGAPARVQAPADSAAGEVAFELAGPGGAALVVPVYVNGQGPFRFVLDTGATLTCVDQQIAARLELPQARGVTGVGAGVGSSGRMEIVRVDSVRLGAARAEELIACALDLQHIGSVGLEVDGLLGLNFLRAFRVTIDFEREILLLQEPT